MEYHNVFKRLVFGLFFKKTYI